MYCIVDGLLTSSFLAYKSVLAATIFIFKFATGLLHPDTPGIVVWLARFPSAKSGRTSVEPVLTRWIRVGVRRRVLIQTNPTVSPSIHTVFVTTSVSLAKLTEVL